MTKLKSINLRKKNPLFIGEGAESTEVKKESLRCKVPMVVNTHIYKS
jgi:hypothetical protein